MGKQSECEKVTVIKFAEVDRLRMFIRLVPPSCKECCTAVRANEKVGAGVLALVYYKRI